MILKLLFKLHLYYEPRIYNLKNPYGHAIMKHWFQLTGNNCLSMRSNKLYYDGLLNIGHVSAKVNSALLWSEKTNNDDMKQEKGNVNCK